MADIEAIKKYYTSTQFEYKLIWNWRLKQTPALHFGYYDEKASKHGDAVNRANEALAEWAGIRPGSRIVDAGCGLGHSAIWLSQHYNAVVTGITVVPKQVETIHKNLAKQPVANVDFQVGNYLQMPFADNSLDVVWAFESVCHAANKVDFYKEAYRVLKPGGMLVMAEYLRTGRPLSNQQEAMLKDVFAQWAIPDLDTLEEHQQHANNAGFSSFNNNDVTRHVIKSYRNLRETCRRYEGLSRFLWKMGIISKLRHNNLLGSARQADAIEQGVFTYHHIAAVK